MKGFTLFKRGECPICIGARKDCRKSDESGMIFCRESNANPKGFIFRGSDRWGFGLWQPSEAAEAFAQKSSWQRDQDQRQREQEQRRQQQIAKQLPAVERDKFYQKILNQMALGQEELSELQRRGFALEQIQADGYRSVAQWERVNGTFPANLPGLLASGSLNSQPGIIFPIRDVENRVIALSIRLRDGSNGRYRWITSATKKNPDGASPHLNGELPLSVFEPGENQGDAIWLPEGVGIKPSLVRYRLGVPVVGASSGLFSGSPNTCKLTLEKLSDKYRTQKLVIPVDAGDVRNAQVCQRWAGEFEFLRSLGYEVQIAWWGQVTKDHPDIDELDDLSKIKFINSEDFLAWAERGGIEKNASPKVSPYKASILSQPTSNDKSPKPGNSQLSKTNQESLSSPQSTIFSILNPPLVASSPILSLRDGISKVLPIPESVASCLTTEEKAPRKERRWFERILNRIKKVFSKSKQQLPRLGFKCFKEDNPGFEEKIRKVQRKLRALSYQTDIELSQRYLPSELVTQLPKSGLIGIKAPKGCGKSVLLKKIIALAKKQGIPVLSITPRIALGREQAIKWEVTWIDDYGVMQTRAEDTTKQIQEVANKREQARNKLDELETIFHHQLSLLDNAEAEKLDQQKIDLRAEIERYGEEIENINASSVRTLGLCWDSLWRTKDRDLKNSLIIIDEAELGFKHFVAGSTCRRNRPYLLKVFTDKIRECLMSGGRVILSDADLTDLPINYVRELLPIPINPFIVRNDYIGNETRWLVDFRSGSRGTTLDEIIANAKLGFHLVITTDSQAEAEALEKKILDEFSDFCAFLDSEGEITAQARKKEKAIVVRLDRNTAESEAGKKFIQKPNESILHWKPRILIYTPTLGVGVSIDESTQRIDEEWGESVPYFDFVYGLFFGVIEPSQCRQQLARVRANVPRIVWCKEFNRGLEGCTSFFPDEIKRQMLKYNHSALSIIDLAKGIAGYDADDEEIREAMLKLLQEAWDSESRCWKDPSLDLYAAFKARENYSLWNLANVLREELEDEGHKVISLDGGKSDLLEEIADIKDELKMEEARLIAEAPIMPLEEAQKLLNKIGITKQERRSVTKTLLQDELPEIELTAEFIYKAVVSDRRRWLNRHKLFWHLSNFNATKSADTDHWLSRMRKFAEGNPFIPDIRSLTPKVQAIRESGLLEIFVDLENLEKIYEGDSEEAKRFLKRALSVKDILQTAFNITVTRKSEPIALANRILSKTGLALEKVSKSKKDNRYRLAVALSNDPDRLAVLSALDLKWQIACNPVPASVEMGGELPSHINKNLSSPPIGVSQGINGDTFQSGAAAVCSDEPKTPVMLSQQATEVGGELPGHINENLSSPPIEEGVSQEGETNPIELAVAFEFCESPADFAAVIEGYPSDVVEDAIALQGSQPRRQQLSAWYDAVANDTTSVHPLSQNPIIEVSENTSERLPQLTAYRPGEEVWAYFPQSKDKWMKATVEWIRGRTIRVVNGALGMFVERADMIAPGHWELVL
jgi:hypothetical protein